MFTVGGLNRLFEITATTHRWDSMTNLDPNPFQVTLIVVSVRELLLFSTRICGSRSSAPSACGCRYMG